MHPNEGQLKAYADQNLPAAEHEPITAHLAGCPRCQARAQAMFSRTHQVQQSLAALNPQPRESGPSVGAARIKLQSKLNQQESQTMFNKLFSSRMRPVWGALVIVLALALAFSFPQVRVAANSFLGLFRVQQVAVVPVDPEKVSSKVALADPTIFNSLFDDMQEEVLGEALANASVEEASAVAGIPVRVPGQKDVKISVEQGTRVTVKIDQPRLQAIFDEVQMDIQIPKELDGATLTGEIRPVVFMSFDCKQETRPTRSDPDDPAAANEPVTSEVCTELIQVSSPTINAPAGLDIASIGESFLQLMGMSPQEAKDFSQRIDWATTLVVPVPQSGSYENVVVDGVEGVLLRENSYASSEHYILVWARDGVVYGLAGEGSNDEALAIANSLK